MSNLIQNRVLILEVMLSTKESIKHTYPILPYNADDPHSIETALNDIKATLENIKQLLAGEVRAFEYPGVGYNPAHVVGVKIDAQDAEELQDAIAQEQRRIGFAT